MTRFEISRLLSLSAAAFGMALALAGPARALDDDGKKNIFSSVGELFSLGEAPSASIQYHDRAPLVIPPSLQQLPSPQAAADDEDWMRDRKASGRRDPRAAALVNDKMRGTLVRPPNEYFRKQGNKPLPPADGATHVDQGALSFLGRLNPWYKDED